MSYLGSFFGIGLVGQSIDTFQEAENVTSNNIVNANTPGASRQVVELQQATPINTAAGYPYPINVAVQGEGVAASIQRIHDASYDSLYRGAYGSQNYFTTEQNALQAVQSSLGEPNNGINTQLSAFQTAINQLIAQASGGSSTAARSQVLTTAQTLSTSLNNAASAVSSQQQQVLSQAGTTITSVNTILDQIAQLNGQIRASVSVGDTANTLMDQRDQLVDQLSQYVSVQTAVQPDGSALVSLGGQALVDDSIAYHLAAPTITTGTNGTPAMTINFQSNPGGSGVPLGTGQLAAYQDLYNNKLSGYGTQLNNFASSLASEVNRVTESGYDQNGIAGTALFQPIVGSLPISASNIKVGITDPAQLAVALASTAAGSLTQPMNSANNNVDTSAAIDQNGNLANPPGAAGTQGTLTVTVDGVAQTFNYNTTGTDSTIDGFITDFNNRHLGVTASFDPSSQQIVFARDPSNIDLVHRALQGSNPPTAAFTIADAPAAGAGILSALGASGINGVQQNASNAFGAADNAGANALLQLFNANVGVPPVQTSSAAAVAAGSRTITLPAGVTNVQVGQLLTVDAGSPQQENVVVTSIAFSGSTESFTATFGSAHAAGFSIASAQTQTLGQYYQQTVTQMGIDAQTAITGTQSQTALTDNINKTRQGIDGINIDEETQNLITYQNAYQAAARTMNVLDSLLNTVINTLGVGQGG